MVIDTLQRLADRADIQDCLVRYARGVDRGDWDLVRSTYHPDAHDQHGEFSGGVEALIAWLQQRFDGVDNSMHFLGNCGIEFVDADHAFVETYFASRRLRPPTEAERATLPPNAQMCREAWGRYVDQFTRCDGAWRVAQRIVVIDMRYTTMALDAVRTNNASVTWGQRDANDPSWHSRAALFAAFCGRTINKPLKGE